MLFSFDFLGPCFHSVRFQVFVINGPGFFSLDRKAFSFGFSGLLGVRYRVFAINGPGFFFTWSESVLIWFFRAPVFIVYVIGFSSSMGRAFFHLVGECSHLVFPGSCFHSVRYRVFAINGPGFFHLIGKCSHLVFPGSCFHSVRYRVFAINGPGFFSLDRKAFSFGFSGLLFS